MLEKAGDWLAKAPGSDKDDDDLTNLYNSGVLKAKLENLEGALACFEEVMIKLPTAGDKTGPKACLLRPRLSQTGGEVTYDEVFDVDMHNTAQSAAATVRQKLSEM